MAKKVVGCWVGRERLTFVGWGKTDTVGQGKELISLIESLRSGSGVGLLVDRIGERRFLDDSGTW